MAREEAPRRRADAEADEIVSGGGTKQVAAPTQPQFKLPDGPPALSGKLAEVMQLIKQEKVEQALVMALRWRAEQPGNVMALVALGEALQAHGNTVLAARVYGSIIDLFPSRADMRRFAGERLEALGRGGQDMAVDTYAQAVKQRPDHALGHRLLAFALFRQGKAPEALDALEAGVKQRYRINRSGVLRILREDMGLVAAAIAAKEPNRKAELDKRLDKHGARVATEPSMRFVLTWETDANDVDFHIYDGQGGHASYRSKSLSSGGTLFADVTNGYGPECFAIPGEASAFPYRLVIHYYSRGPMGYGMGKLQVVQHDGKGGLFFDDRPFVAMNDKAYVDLGPVKGSLQ
jgi:tetratricopeptide (TPR) repeat protein